MSVVEAVTVTLYRATNRPKGWRKGKPRRQRWLAYRDAAWAKLRERCRCVLPDFDPETSGERKLCRYHDKEYRAVDWPQHYYEEPAYHGFRAPEAWGLPRSDEAGLWDYGRAVAYRLARFYRHLDEKGGRP